MEKGDNRLKFEKGQAALNVRVQMMGAKMHLKNARYENLYLR